MEPPRPEPLFRLLLDFLESTELFVLDGDEGSAALSLHLRTLGSLLVQRSSNRLF